MELRCRAPPARPSRVCGGRARRRTDRQPLTGTAGRTAWHGRPGSVGVTQTRRVLSSEHPHRNCVYDALELRAARRARHGAGRQRPGDVLRGGPALFRPHGAQLPGPSSHNCACSPQLGR
ncbi:hypothetical protein Nmel_014774 [Mimus melanotis]